MKSLVKAATPHLLAICMLSLLCHSHTVEPDAPVVHTKRGSVRGKYVRVKGKESSIHAYLGVPFAKPPVGPLRLNPPQPAGRWEGVRDATQQPSICVQDRQVLVDALNMMVPRMTDAVFIPGISEDCLYLNIYTPATAAQDDKLPVMVWIHGGALVMGSASMCDGSALAAYQDMVVVMVQYRLGGLGFLSTGDEQIPGNFGLLDQVAALRWVQEHIHNFGGNPGSVTIFGQSAGGVSVSLLALSPLSDGLFHGAIAESGTAAMDALFTQNPLPVAELLANVSGCDITSTKAIADCLRSMDIDTMLTIEKDHLIRYQVNVDRHFLTKPVDELYQNHALHKTPFMTGFNSHEAGWVLPNLYAPPGWTEGMDIEDAMAVVAMFYPELKEGPMKELVAAEYLGTSGDRLKTKDGFTELLSNLMFNIPTIKTANSHRDAGAPVYLYEYRHPPKFLQERRPGFVGSDHDDELVAVLGTCFTSIHAVHWAGTGTWSAPEEGPLHFSDSNAS